MKRSVDETAERFDEMSDEYDDTRTEEHVETARRVVERALESTGEGAVVVDIGTGTGVLALEIAPHVGRVYGLDISDGMLGKARRKSEEESVENVVFDHGKFRTLSDDLGEMGVSSVDAVVSNFAMHHLDDEEKREAVEEISRVLNEGGRVVIGDLIIFDESDTSREFYDPEVDDPSTVEHLVDVFEDNGFSVEHERLSEMTGVVEAVLR